MKGKKASPSANERASKTKSSSSNKSASKKDFLVVGIGASAGGVRAVQEFFKKMPASSGMAFVVILHLAPDHDSNLGEVIQAKTAMPVSVVNETERVEPNRIYVIPPNRRLEMTDGVIRSIDLKGERGERVAVDVFFRTLADEYHENAVCVILSGAGTDGTIGLKAVKEANGWAIVQSPEDAEHDSMPRSAIATGVVDWILPVGEMPERLLQFRDSSERLHLTIGAEADAEEGDGKVGREIQAGESLREILTVLRVRTGHDFSNYKTPTLVRRIARHLQIHDLEDIPTYLELLREKPEDIHSLLKNLLINVTNFFRDRDAWEILERDVVPQLFAGKQPGDTVRVWSAGCASGEEAYSLAIILSEYAEKIPEPPKIQVFATDVDEDAIAEAREHRFPQSIEADVSIERLKRFFVKEGKYYRVKKELRETVLFAPHNVLRDPPFSKLDLVVCRNLLIYLNRDTQERAMGIFHFALLHHGFLFLGSSETAESVPHLFQAIDKKLRIYSRRPVDRPSQQPVPQMPVVGRWEVKMPELKPKMEADRGFSRGEHHFKLLESLAPPSVLVNQDFEIQYMSESAGRYLRMRGGAPSSNLLKLAHPDLLTDLRAALFTAQRDGKSAEFPNVHVQLEGREATLNIIVRPVEIDDESSDYLLVIFDEDRKFVLPEDKPKKSRRGSSPERDDAMESTLLKLEEELERTKSSLRAMGEQHEVSVEEHKASNEELQAINEELRSTTEELETSKEELQSVNEELTTVNHELKEKMDETSRTNSDLQNLMASTDIATIFLDREFRIKRFTPPVEHLFNITAADIGRPLEHFTNRLDYPNLQKDATQVLRNLTPLEREVRDNDNRVYLTRIVPYRTLDDRIEGVVLNFVDITERKRAEEATAEDLRDTKLLRELGMQLTSEGDIQANYDKILDAAIALTRADAGTVQTLDAERQELVVIATRGFSPKVADHFQRLDASSKTSCGIALATDTRTFVDFDDPAVDDSDGSLRKHLEDGYRSAQSTPLVTRSGKAIGMLSTHWKKHYRPSERELRFLDLLVRQTADLIEQRQAQEALRESEAKIRTMFETMLEACCIFEMIYDDRGKPVDWRILEANPGYERESGLKDVAGKLASEVMPGTEAYWYEAFDRVVKTGEAERIEKWHQPTQRWVHSSTARVGGSGSRRLVSVFYDITERKQREQNQQFLIKFSDALRAEQDADAIANRAVRMIAEHLRVDRCYVGIALLDDNRGIFPYQFGNDRVAPMPEAGVSLSDFPEALRKTFDETLVITDFQNTEGLSKTEKQNFAALGFGALVVANVRKEERKPYWSINAVSAVPRVWTDLEIRLIEEVTERTWAAIERAKAEAALRESERRRNLALEAGAMGTFLWHVQEDRGEQDARMMRLLGHEGDVTLAEVLGEIAHTDDRERYASEVEQSLDPRGDGRLDTDFRVVHADGAVHWLHIYGQTVFEGEPLKPVRMYGTAFDITAKKRAEEALRESEARFRRLFTNNMVPMFIWTPEGEILDSNDGFLNLIGYMREELEAGELRWDKLTPSEAGERDALAVAEVIEKGFCEPYEKQFSHKDGHLVSFLVGAGVFDYQKFSGVCFAIDLTERKRAEEALRESREKYLALFTSMDEAYAVVEVLQDEKGKWNDFLFLEVNPAFVKQTGMEYPVGRKATELLGTPNPRWAQIYGQVIDTGEPVRLEEREETLGRIFDLYIFRLGDEGSRRVAVLFTDITARKQSEAALRESEERLRDVLDSMAEGFALLGSDFTILDVNEETVRLDGRTRDELIGHSHWEAFPGTEDSPIGDIFRRVAQEKVPGSLEHEYHWDDKRSLWIDMRAYPTGDGGVAIFWRDITDRKRTENALRESEEKYRMLFETMDEGYLLCEVIFDENEKPVDILYLEANPAAARIAGRDFSGQRMREIAPDYEDYWFEIYGRVALTGEAVRAEHYAKPHGRWFDFYAVKLGGQESRRVAAVFQDTTDRKRREANLAFLADLQAEFAPLATTEEIMRAAGERIAAYFDLTHCLFVEIDEQAQTANVIYDLPEAGAAANFVGTYDLTEFHTEDEMRRLHGGRSIVINDVQEKPRPAKAAAKFESLGIRSLVTTPYDSGGRWRFALSAQCSVPRVWREDERKLLEELAARIYIRIERARAEELLRESEERLRIAVEAAEMGTWTWDLEKNEVVWNERHFTLFGMKPHKKPVRSETFFDRVHPDDQGWLSERLRQAIETNTNFRAEFCIIRADDHQTRWMEGYGHVVEHSEGKPVRMSGVMSDITSRKRAEEAVRQSRERLELIMQSISDYAIITTDIKGIINGWNTGAEKTFGWTAIEAVGQPCALIFTPEDRAAKVPEGEMDTARKEGVAEDVRWHIRKDGTRFFASGTVSPIRDGELEGFVKITSDQTERMKAETALREKETLQKLVTAQEDQRKRIARDLHDELGQQLTALRIKLDAVSKNQQEPVLLNQLNEIQNIARSIDDGVDFLAFELRPTTLDDLGLTAALDNYIKQWMRYSEVRAQLTLSNLKRTRFAPEVETCLYRIVQEALNNTHKHARASNVDVILEKRGDTLILIVEDNGKGFNPKSKAKRKQGMGLIGMKERAQLVSGTFEVETAPNQGTTIYVRIPFSAAKEK